MKLIPAEYLIRNTVDSKPESGARSVVNEIRVHSEWFGRVQEVNMDFRVQEIGSSIKESSVQWLFFSLLYILCAPCSLISCASQLILDLASPYVWSSGLESFGRPQSFPLVVRSFSYCGKEERSATRRILRPAGGRLNP